MKTNLNDCNPVISYLTLRRFLGILGIALPILVFVCSQFGGWTPLRETISSYYFTNTREIFVGILITFSAFLFTYKGYDFLDNLIMNVASVFALFIALFPAMSESSGPANYLFQFLSADVNTVVHYISAALFFILLAFISFFLFTKTDPKKGPITNQKKNRNTVYRVCGIIIFACIVLLGIYNVIPDQYKTDIRKICPVFILESIALLAFGISWLVKGELIMKDRKKA